MLDGTIRLACAADLPAINAIYNHYVLHSTCTYQLEPVTEAERLAWFTKRGPMLPVTVAEAHGEILGWGSLSFYHTRAAYQRTVENSVYVRHDLHRRGLGRALLQDLITRARALGHHSILARISADQGPSVVLHQQLGFQQVGHLREVGFKFGRWLDVLYLQLLLNDAG